METFLHPMLRGISRFNGFRVEWTQHGRLFVIITCMVSSPDISTSLTLSLEPCALPIIIQRHLFLVAVIYCKLLFVQKLIDSLQINLKLKKNVKEQKIYLHQSLNIFYVELIEFFFLLAIFANWPILPFSVVNWISRFITGIAILLRYYNWTKWKLVMIFKELASAIKDLIIYVSNGLFHNTGNCSLDQSKVVLLQ